TFGSSEDTNLYRSDANVLKTDDNFDALSLRVNSTEIVTSSRVLKNIVSVAQSLVPDADSSRDLGSPSYRWLNIRCRNLRFESQSDETPYIVGNEYTAGIRFYHNDRKLTIITGNAENSSWIERIIVPSGDSPVTIQIPNEHLSVGGYGNFASLQINGTEIITSDRILQNIASVAQSLLPDSDGSRDLGSSSYRWRDFWSSGKIVSDGYIAAQGGNTITSNPPSIPTSRLGWKIGLWGSGYWFGIANWTLALRTDSWFGIFKQTNPANDGSGSTPDSHVGIALGGYTGKEIWFGRDFRLISGGANLLKTNASIQPESDNAYDLGSGSYRWRNLELAGYGNLGSLKINGTEVISSSRILTNIASISQSLTPTTNDGYDLGSSSLRWRDGYFSRNLRIGSSLSDGYLYFECSNDAYIWHEESSDAWMFLECKAPSGYVATVGLFRTSQDGTPKFRIMKGDGTTNIGVEIRPREELIQLGSDVVLYRSASDVLKTDDNFDTLSLKVGGSEVISSSRVLRNISNVDQSLLPLTGSSYNLGSSDLKWNAVYANNFYGTAHYADVCFQDLICPICNKHFKVNDKLVLLVTKVSEKEIRCVPAHLECA
ncbi:hypothetical protein DRO30_00140, partial [Candidatus Bathyarchaeota archaeon]